MRVQDRMNAVVLAMEDKVLNWYQWWEVQELLRAWDEFKLAVMRRFQPGLLHNPLGPLLSLGQKGNIYGVQGKV